MLKKFILAFAGAALLMAIVPGVASAEPPFVERGDCPGDTNYFLFEYEDSDVVGVDSGCAEKNDVYPSDIPGLIANKIHTSCSDKIPDGSEPADKSDFGRKADGSLRYVEAYLIIKLKKDGQVDKTCGVGDPIPSGGTAGYATTIALVAAAGAGLTALAYRRRQNTLAGTEA
jgi:hypothetical protein